MSEKADRLGALTWKTYFFAVKGKRAPVFCVSTATIFLFWIIYIFSKASEVSVG